jgi:DNA replication protein DnaD
MEKVFYGVMISKKLKIEFKAFCASNGRKMADAAEEAIRMWLKQQGGERKWP